MLTRGVMAAAMALLQACFGPSEPDTVSLTFGAYRASPVVLLRAQVNGMRVEWPDKLVSGAADNPNYSPRGGSGVSLLDFPPSIERGQVVFSMTWVELFTQKGWTAEVRVPIGLFHRYNDGRTMEMAPIFGPNGLLVIASDPPPVSATNIPRVDVGRVCGRRSPEHDRDYTRAPGDIIGLADLLARGRTAIDAPECPEQP